MKARRFGGKITRAEPFDVDGRESKHFLKPPEIRNYWALTNL